VAFCFYNLSSIVNGLVYFDQFSLLPWNHLALVGLGIVILLGGVWIVSFNSGGGGVNVGTWRDEDGDEVEGDSSDTCEEVSPATRGRSARNTILFERSAISESDVSHYFTDSQPPVLSPPGPTNHIQDYMSLSQDIDERPNLRIRTGVQRRRQTNELRSPVQAHHHLSVLSPQLPAFSIGISPASPGFVVVPRERRRRISGLSMESQTRRSQSEGDIFPVPGSVDEAVEPTLSDGEHLQRSPPPQRSRWRWLRMVFRREDKTI
jgi:magnesium transporter